MGKKMKEEIVAIIINICIELNEQLKNKIDVSKKENAVLYGENGVLDSLGLINLIVSAESEIELKFKETITIADGASLPPKNSPFKTVGSFADYIFNLLNKESLD
jgi:acyl carrier protein